MPLFRIRRAVICTFFALGGLTATLTPAHADVTSGKAVAGAGGLSCGLSVSCASFDQLCSMTANDIDASVRAAAVGGQFHVITWSATIVGPTPPQNSLVVLPFTSQCAPIGLPIVVPTSGSNVPFPGGTAYVAAWPIDKFAQFSWVMH